jgi:hypothetical protein
VHMGTVLLCYIVHMGTVLLCYLSHLEKTLFWFRLKGNYSAGAGSTLRSLTRAVDCMSSLRSGRLHNSLRSSRIRR